MCVSCRFNIQCENKYPCHATCALEPTQRVQPLDHSPHICSPLLLGRLCHPRHHVRDVHDLRLLAQLFAHRFGFGVGFGFRGEVLLGRRSARGHRRCQTCKTAISRWRISSLCCVRNTNDKQIASPRNCISKDPSHLVLWQYCRYPFRQQDLPRQQYLHQNPWWIECCLLLTALPIPTTVSLACDGIVSGCWWRCLVESGTKAVTSPVLQRSCG